MVLMVSRSMKLAYGLTGMKGGLIRIDGFVKLRRAGRDNSAART
jgi:hypothetical protein